MPKKARFDHRGVNDIEAFINDVEGTMFRLGLRLRHYFKEKDEVRERFIALERTFLAYTKDLRPELQRIAEKKKAARINARL